MNDFEKSIKILRVTLTDGAVKNGYIHFPLTDSIFVDAHYGEGIAFIIDTKWKRLKEQAYREGVTSTDVYQMYAYSTQYAAPDVLLLYPHHRDLGLWKPRRAEYWVHGVNGSLDLNQRVCVTSLDLQDLEKVPAQLRSMFVGHQQQPAKHSKST